MAKFTDLSNEIVIAIASFIRKPADILHLCIAERRSHEIIIPLLYENIVLHDLDYPTHERHTYERHTHKRHTPRWSTLNSKIHLLGQLFEQQQRNGKRGDRRLLGFGGECRSLYINMHHYRDYKNGCPTDSVIELFSLLPFLKNLSLFSKIQQHHDHDHGGFYVYEVDRLSRALYPLRDTFETLTLVLNSKKLPWASDGVCIDGIRNLHCFKAMKNLCIQSPYLIGWRNEWPHPAESAKSLGQLLPPNLKDLTIHCCAIENFDERRIADHFQTPLDDKLSTQSFGPSQDFAWRDR